MLLTVASLLFGAVLSVMFAVDGSEIDEAIAFDTEKCENSENGQGWLAGCKFSYDTYIFLSGFSSSLGCGAVVIVVLLITWSVRLLLIDEGDVHCVNCFAKQHFFILQSLYPVLVFSFISGAYAVINVAWVKAKFPPVQYAMYDLCLIWWLCLGITAIVLVRKFFKLRNLFKGTDCGTNECAQENQTTHEELQDSLDQQTDVMPVSTNEPQETDTGIIN